MSYSFSVCDETVRLKSKSKHFKSLTHKNYVNFIRINYTIQNPNLFDVDKTFNDYIINQNKKFSIISCWS